MTKFNSLDNNFNYRLVFALAFFFASLAIIFLILWPKAQELKIIREEVKEKTNEFNTREDYFSGLNQVNNQLKNHQEGFSMINYALPNDPSLPSLFNHVQKVAGESGLVFAKIGSFKTSYFLDEPSPFQGDERNKMPSSLTDIRETDFNIEVIGNYSSFKEFLSKLENSIRLIRVENIYFSSEKEEESFIFDLKIKVYSY